MVGPGPLVLVALAVSRLTPCGNVSHAILTMKRDSLYLYIIPIACVVLLLVFTLRLYTFAYFWNDDFNNLYWVQTQSFSQMVGYVVNPASDFFRPAGMFLYWAALQLFDRNAQAYHLLLWSLHAINVGLVYWILRRFTGSHAGAMVGAMLFSSQYLLNDLYWSFGTIFEVASAMLYFAGILLWSRERRSLKEIVLASVVFLLAIKAKEMAITLPGIWLSYDLLIRRNMRWKMLVHLILPVAIGAGYGFRKVLEMHGTYPTHPYYMDMRWLTLGRGFGGYFNWLFNVELRWQIWAIGFTAILLMFLFLKKKPAAFFQLYIFITFLPVIFLINHREFFYWYIPLLGVSGLAAILTRDAAAFFGRFIPQRLLAPTSCALFALLCYAAYGRTRDLTQSRREWQQGIAGDYRAFVRGLQSIPAPPPGETLFFRSYPQYFDRGVLLFATQIALRRTDIGAQLVDTFPPDARYRLRFEASRIIAEE